MTIIVTYLNRIKPLYNLDELLVKEFIETFNLMPYEAMAAIRSAALCEESVKNIPCWHIHVCLSCPKQCLYEDDPNQFLRIQIFISFFQTIKV